MSTIKNFEAMLARGQDSGLLRFGLGSAYLGQDDPDRAIPHLAEPVIVEAEPGELAARMLVVVHIPGVLRLEQQRRTLALWKPCEIGPLRLQRRR